MSEPQGEAQTALPPLLRHQVFGNHGAAEWLREPGSRAALPAGLLLLAALVASAALAALAVCLPHTRQVAARVEAMPAAANCASPGDDCEIHLRLLAPTAADSEGIAVSALLLQVDGQWRRLPASSGGEHLLRVRWPSRWPLPAGGFAVRLERRAALYRWVLPGAGPTPAGQLP